MNVSQSSWQDGVAWYSALLLAVFSLCGAPVSAEQIPIDHAILSAPATLLQWDATPGASSYNVYFGVDRQSVAAATEVSPAFFASTSSRSVQINVDLPAGAVRYWRVDAVVGGSVAKGPVHDFSGRLKLAGVFPGSVGYYELLQHELVVEGDFAFAGFPEWVSASADARPGQVRIWRREASDGTWAEAQVLDRPTGTAAGAKFGSAVAVRGDVCWIGAPLDGPGSVFQYILNRATGRWERTTLRLRSQAAVNGELFGSSLALGDGWIAVGVGKGGSAQTGVIDVYDAATGAWQARIVSRKSNPSPGTGVGGKLSADGNVLATMDSGSRKLEIFERMQSGAWNSAASLTPPNYSADQTQATSFAVAGDVCLIGIPSQSSSIPGGAYAYARGPSGSWTLEKSFAPFASYAYFSRVAMRGNRAAIHLPGDASTDSQVAMWKRESDKTWTPLGTTTATPAAEQAVGSVISLAVSDRFVMQSATINSKSVVRLYDHNAETNNSPTFISAAIAFAEELRPFNYEIETLDPDAGDDPIVSVTSGLPQWLTFAATGGGKATLTGTPPAGTSGTVNIQLKATDRAGASAVQSLALGIVPVGRLPVIATLSPDQTVEDHDRLSLSVTLADSEATTYRWLFNGVAVPGATDSTLVIDHAQASDAGVYTVEVTRPPAFISSPPIRVIVAQVADRFGGDWTTLGAGNSRSGRYPATLGNHVFVPAWSRTLATDGSVVNQAVTGDGRVFASITKYDSASILRAFDASNGGDLWSRSLPNSNYFTQPAFHRGMVVVQRGLSTPDVRGFNAASGTQQWVLPYTDQSRQPYVPTVAETGVVFMTGVGIAKSNLSGMLQWNVPGVSVDRWAALIHGGRLFVWQSGKFAEIRESDGFTLWSLDLPWSGWEPYGTISVAAAEGNHVALLGSNSLSVVDVSTRSILWTQTGTFSQSSPAIGDGVVYVITPGAVIARSALDGAEGRVYPTLDASGNARTAQYQPVVLDDYILASSPSETWVIDRTTGATVQRIAAGGPLSYSNGLLMIAGQDGVLRTFEVNQPPALAEQAETFWWTEDSPATWTLALIDPDGDVLQAKVTGAPEWLKVLPPANGVLTFGGMPTRSSDAGLSEFTVSVTDGKTNAVSRTVRVGVTAVNDKPTAAPPFEVQADEDAPLAPLRLTDFFDDEEDTPAGLVYDVEGPLRESFESWKLDPQSKVFTAVLRADFHGLVPLIFRARDLEGEGAATIVTFNIRPVPDAPRAPANLPAPSIPDDGRQIAFDTSKYFTEVDEGDSLRFTLSSNNARSLFGKVEIDPTTGVLTLEWAPYRWGSARLTLRATDATGLFVESALDVALPAPSAPAITLQGDAKLNRQTGLVEQSVIVRNTASRPIGGFNLWVDGGTDASLYNGAPGSTLTPPGPTPWFVPYFLPLAAGEEVTIVLEFHSPQRKANPSVPGAQIINGDVQLPAAKSGAGAFAISRVIPRPDGLLVEFPSIPRTSYQIEFSPDGAVWTISPTPIRAAGTAVQWIDRGPPFTTSRPEAVRSRYYRVRSR